MSNLLRRCWLLTLVIVLLALTLRLAHVYDYSASPLTDGWLLVDARYYDVEAWRIAKGAAASTEPYFMAPLYPHVLAALYSAVKDPAAAAPYHRGPQAARWVQCFTGALCAAAIAWIAFLLLGRRAGFLSGLLAATYEPFIYQDGLLMPSSLILLLNLLTLLALVLAIRRRTWRWWLAAGLLLGLACVAHGTALLLGPGIAVWLLLFHRDLPLRRRAAWVALVALGACAPVGLVFARNLIVSGDAVLLTSNAGRNFYIGNGLGATGTFRLLPTVWEGSSLSGHMTGFVRDPSDPAASEVSRLYTREALAEVVSDPLRFLRLEFRKARLLFGAIEVGIIDQLYFARQYSRVLSLPLPTFLFVAPLGLLGLGLAIRRGRDLSPVYLVLVCQSVAFLLMFILARYRLTIAACLMIFAAGSIVWAWDELRRGSRRSLLVAAAVLSLLVVAVSWPLPGIDKQRGWGNQYMHLGKVYSTRGDTEQAVSFFELAIDADFHPKDGASRSAECFLFLGRVQERAGLLREAKASYDRGLALVHGAEESERGARLFSELTQALKRFDQIMR